MTADAGHSLCSRKLRFFHFLCGFEAGLYFVYIWVLFCGRRSLCLPDKDDDVILTVQTSFRAPQHSQSKTTRVSGSPSGSLVLFIQMSGWSRGHDHRFWGSMPESVPWVTLGTWLSPWKPPVFWGGSGEERGARLRAVRKGERITGLRPQSAHIEPGASERPHSSC